MQHSPFSVICPTELLAHRGSACKACGWSECLHLFLPTLIKTLVWSALCECIIDFIFQPFRVRDELPQSRFWNPFGLMKALMCSLTCCLFSGQWGDQCGVWVGVSAAGRTLLWPFHRPASARPAVHTGHEAGAAHAGHYCHGQPGEPKPLNPVSTSLSGGQRAFSALTEWIIP